MTGVVVFALIIINFIAKSTTLVLAEVTGTFYLLYQIPADNYWQTIIAIILIVFELLYLTKCENW